MALIAAASLATADPTGNCDTISALETFDKAGVAPQGAACSTFLNLFAKTGISCRWEFPYRDKAAPKMAAALWTLLQDCRPGMQLTSDLRVNHPDSYQLQEWAGRTGIYRVSQKDKAGLQRTIVFLRFEKR